MAFYASKNIYRGALAWPEAGLVGGPSVRFFQKIVWRGPSIAYEPFTRESPHRLSASLSFSDDNGPFLRFKDADSYFWNRRKNALETAVRYRYIFGYRNLFSVGGFIAKDYIAYKSIYYELTAEIPLVPFVKLALGAGRGSQATNEYIFGSGAVDGWGHYRYAINAVIPFLPWNGIIINSFTTSKIISGGNRNASFVDGNIKNSAFSSRWIFNF